MKTEATMVVSAKSGKSSAMRSRMSAAVLFCRHVDEHGRISRPIDFRSAFVHLGSRAMLDEAAAARGVHDVYTEGESAEHPRRTGVFPDGATRVKEIRGVASGGLSTDSPVM